MDKKRIAFHNLGCKVNAAETEAMIRQMEERGYEIVPFDGPADIYVVNTCTVTNIADRKSRQMLHRARKMNPEALIVAAGCYVQADPDRAAEDDAVDLVVGNDQKSRLAELIESRTNSVEDIGASRQFESMQLGASREHSRAFIKIQDGCNQFCSYCLIPYVRGRVRSRRPEEIVLEAKILAAAGFREIVLTGIHISSYGTDFVPAGGKKELPETAAGQEPWGTALADLVEKLAQIPQIARIRLGSLEPRIITESFVRRMAACEKICPHFHLSLQSGCGDTLRRMNRHYTPEEYREKCRLLRTAFDHPAITTDVIAGFPGETPEEFEQTRAFLEDIRLYEAHIFKYSRRKGTRADRMADQVPEEEKTRRSHVLQEQQAAYTEAFRRYYVGREVEVLLEKEDVRDGQPGFTGTTREYINVWVPAAEGRNAGDIIRVILEETMLPEE